MIIEATVSGDRCTRAQNADTGPLEQQTYRAPTGRRGHNSGMEAFESLVAVALESEKFVVSSAVKFSVKLKTKRAAYDEFQSHGYEVDLVGARANRLV